MRDAPFEGYRFLHLECSRASWLDHLEEVGSQRRRRQVEEAEVEEVRRLEGEEVGAGRELQRRRSECQFRCWYQRGLKAARTSTGGARGRRRGWGRDCKGETSLETRFRCTQSSLTYRLHEGVGAGVEEARSEQLRRCEKVSVHIELEPPNWATYELLVREEEGEAEVHFLAPEEEVVAVVQASRREEEGPFLQQRPFHQLVEAQEEGEVCA